jgi:uncharacterized protein YggE
LNVILKALAAAGVPEKAIESTSPALQRSQSYDLQQFPMGTEERTRRQFSVSQFFSIRVKPEQADAVLNTAIDAGASEMAWVQWTVDDPSGPLAQASAKALANARVIAEQIAAKSGVHLGDVVNVTENQRQAAFNSQYSSVPPAFGMGDSNISVGTNSMVAQAFAVNSRHVEYRASLSVSFAIE